MDTSMLPKTLQLELAELVIWNVRKQKKKKKEQKKENKRSKQTIQCLTREVATLNVLVKDTVLGDQRLRTIDLRAIASVHAEIANLKTNATLNRQLPKNKHTQALCLRHRHNMFKWTDRNPNRIPVRVPLTGLCSSPLDS